MQLALQYAQLKASIIRLGHRANVDVPVTVEEIAGYLYCTERNVKILIRKMSDLGWIMWTPGRGRGHRSSIRFLASAEELILAEAKMYVEQGNLNSAMSLFQLEGLDPGLTDRFLAWLGDFFGYRGTQEAGAIETLRLPMHNRILTLDPAEILFSRDLHFAKQTFDTLLRFDPARGSLEPSLAHNWASSENGQVWTFYLRKRVRFHHGRELTAADVAYTWNRLSTLGSADSPNRWLGETIADIQVVDRLTLQVKLEAPNYMFLHYVSSYPMAILPEDIYKSRSINEVRKLPVGTGPFRVTRHDEGGITLEAFEDYFREGAHLDRIELLYVPEIVSNRNWQQWNFHMGKLDHYKQPAPAHWRKKEVMTLGSNMLSFNLRKQGPQQNLHVRRAINIVLNRGGMIAELGLNGAIPAEGFLPPDTPREWPCDNQPEQARELLTASGYGGQPLKLLFTPSHSHEAKWIKERCAAIGIPLLLTECTHEEMSSADLLQESDVLLGGVVADDDEARCLIEMYKVGNMLIRVCATDEQRQTFNDAIARIVAEPDANVRLQQIRGMERLLTEEYHVLFLVHVKQQTVFSPHLKGIAVNTLGWFDFKHIWFRPETKETRPFSQQI
ncbi:ABC transporter substrate-binding protein [Paenibacillus sedimenti]|uniref:SgrR family transcriptional regulator n=1 Tax=Paenibacillus sedimenti TaxID=2770274 RepID=A0A926QJC0_9BACL|nr:ABC transporter substrate-binding protein [Paenibacillus sedimenti]MBD0381400.1 SgrR family transcriptional regulator [Paenibacillus sedimenti]